MLSRYTNKSTVFLLKKYERNRKEWNPIRIWNDKNIYLKSIFLYEARCIIHIRWITFQNVLRVMTEDKLLWKSHIQSNDFMLDGKSRHLENIFFLKSSRFFNFLFYSYIGKRIKKVRWVSIVQRLHRKLWWRKFAKIFE